MNEIPSVFADIPSRLSAAAVLAVPTAGSFHIETTTVDGRSRAMLACAVCSWYGYHVSSTVGGRVGDLFGAADLARLNDAAAAHQCPSAVTRAAAAARLVAPGLVPGEPGGLVLMLDETVNVRGLDQQIAGVAGRGPPCLVRARTAGWAMKPSPPAPRTRRHQPSKTPAPRSTVCTASAASLRPKPRWPASALRSSCAARSMTNSSCWSTCWAKNATGPAAEP